MVALGIGLECRQLEGAVVIAAANSLATVCRSNGDCFATEGL